MEFVQQKKKTMFLLHIGFIVISMLIVVWAIEVNGLNDPAQFEQWAETDLGWPLLIILVSLIMILCAMTPLPAEALTLANGMLFGPLMGTIITWVSAMIGAYVTYAYSKRFKNKFEFKGYDDEKWRQVNDWIAKWGVLGFFLARLVPAIPFFALNVGAAFLPLNDRTYIMVTGIAILPHIVIICCLGEHLVH